MGIGCVTVFADDDAGSWCGVFGRESASLQALGPAAYLDGGEAQRRRRANRMRRHPPRLRFSERTRVIRRSLRVGGSGSVGPTPEQLALFGDKAKARALAARCGVPLAPRGAQGLLRRSERRGRDDQGDRNSLLSE
jgi:pyruvate carboxylase